MAKSFTFSWVVGGSWYTHILWFRSTQDRSWDASRKCRVGRVGGSPTRNVILLVVTGILGGRGRSKILNYLEPRSIFWKVNLPPKNQGFFQAKQGSFGFQVVGDFFLNHPSEKKTSARQIASFLHGFLVKDNTNNGNYEALRPNESMLYGLGLVFTLLSGGSNLLM